MNVRCLPAPPPDAGLRNLHAGWLAYPGDACSSRLDGWDVELEQLQLLQAAARRGRVQPATALGGERPCVPEQVPRGAEERGDVEGGGAQVVGFGGRVGAAHPAIKERGPAIEDELRRLWHNTDLMNEFTGFYPNR